MVETVEAMDAGAAALDPEEVRERIQTWLLGEGWQLSEKTHGDAVWLLEARDGGGRHLVVGQKRGKGDQILLEGAVAIAEPHRRQLAALPEEGRQRLLWDLRFTLLGLGVEFHGVEEPLTRVMVGQRIYSDGLTKDRFLQRVSQVRNGVIAVIWSVARCLNLAPPASPSPGEGVGSRVN
jgi:hypothetical protein